MSDHDEPVFDDSAFDDPAFDDVRDLLAGARATGPVPDEVAARLDATLASLQAERAAERAPGSAGESSEPAVVVPLRRRLGPRVGRVLVAAATVVVIGAGGVGVAQLALTTDGGDSDTAASEAQSDGSAEAPTAGDMSGPTGELENAPKVTARTLREATQLSTAAFADDAALLMRTLDRLGTTATTDGVLPDQLAETEDDRSGDVPGSDAATLDAPPVTTTPLNAYLQRDNVAASSCSGPDAPGSVTLTATLDGAVVALVFRPPADDAQRVEAWSCDGATLLTAATVPS